MPQRQSTALRHLRVISNHLLSAQDEELHNYLELCVSLLHSCPVLEDAFSQSVASPSNEASTLLHKYKTRISALLQSTAPQARWAAVCVIKASIETSASMIQFAGTWVPLMVKLLSRPEPEVTIERTLVTLTRIFTLTASKPTLTRELTTPHLPSFLTSIFTLSPSTSPHLPTILHSLTALLKTHSTTCRPFSQRIHTLVRSIIFGSSEVTIPYDKETKNLARDVFVSLHHCVAPKAQAEEWSNAFLGIIGETEACCNAIFPPIVVEDVHRQQGQGAEVNAGRPNVHGGVLRLEAYLQLLCSFLCNQSPSTPPSTLPVPALLQLLARLFSFTPDSPPNITANPDDYQLLMAYLGKVHVNALALVDTLLRRLSREHASPLMVRLLGEVAFIFNTGGKEDSQTRVAAYKTLSTMLQASGTAFTKKEGKSVMDIVSFACDEVLPVFPEDGPVGGSGKPMMLITQPASTTRKRKANNYNAHADSFLNSEGNIAPTLAAYPGLVEAASELITNVLQYLPSALIRSELRSKIERTAILTRNMDGVLAAVLYPSVNGKRGSSLLPHLVGLTETESMSPSVRLGIEGVVWPRMQTVKYDVASQDDEEDTQEEDEDGDIDVTTTSFGVTPITAITAATPPAAAAPPEQGESRSPTPKEASAFSSPSTSSPYPSPPPAPVPKHATLPPPRSSTTAAATATATAAATEPAQPPAPPPAQKGPPSLLTIPSPTPSKISQPLPPSPLRQSMSMFDHEDEDDADDRMKKKLKMTVNDLMEKAKGSPERTGSPENRDVQKVKIIEGRERGEGEGKPIPMPALKLTSNGSEKGDGDDDDDDDMEIPEIVMGDDSDSE